MNQSDKNTTDNSLKINTLIKRANVVAEKLNRLAEEYFEYENQKSIYAVENQKLHNSILLTKELLREVEELIEEEKEIRAMLRSLKKFQFIKKQKLSDRLDKIVLKTLSKEAHISELKKEQKSITTALNCAKHKMTRLWYSGPLYSKLVEKEYNVIIQNLKNLTGINLELKHDNQITLIDYIELNNENINNEDTENEIVY